MPHHPPIDPELVTALADPAIASPSLTPGDLPDARKVSAAGALTREQCARGGAITVTDRVAEGHADNPEVDLLVLSPTSGVLDGSGGAGASDGSGPAIVYIHGGGMLMGSRFNIDASMLTLVERGATVISVEYRLAPEHPYPAAIDDCVAAWQWVTGHADELGINPGRIAIAGSSAGGGLAAGTTLRIRDEGAAMPSHQILFCPMLDDREITPSSTELDGVARWDRTANRTGWSLYLDGRDGHDDIPAYAAPAREADLASLPPTFIDVGDVETFRDEDIDYVARLSRAGVPVELHVWPGGVHGFTGLAPAAALSQAAEAVRQNYFGRTVLAR